MGRDIGRLSVYACSVKILGLLCLGHEIEAVVGAVLITGMLGTRSLESICSPTAPTVETLPPVHSYSLKAQSTFTSSQNPNIYSSTR